MRIAPERLKRARIRLGLSQTALAKSIDVPASSISRIENGALSGSNLAAKIADALRVHPGWLLGGDEMEPEWAKVSRVYDGRSEYRTDNNVSQMLAEILTKVGEQNAELKYLRNELRETQGRITRLESGLGRSGVGNHRGAG